MDESFTIKATLPDPSLLKTDVKVRTHSYLLDEPESAGGTDQGPNPPEMTVAALGACVAMTLKLYLDNKEWAFDSIECQLKMAYEPVEDPASLSESLRPYLDKGKLRKVISRVYIKGKFDEAQLKRIKIIAGKCPVHRMLQGSTLIEDEIIVV